MGLRARTLWSGGILLAVLLGSAYLGLALFLNGHFRKLEQEQTLRDGTLAFNGVEREVGELAGKISDWSDWDDAYQFMKTRDSAFIRANLDTAVLGNMRLREILFIDFQGRQAAELSQEGGRRAVGSPALAHWVSSDTVLERIRHGGWLQGWFDDGTELLLVVARPIRPTARKGEPAGMLVFARRFDAKELKRLETVFPFVISLRPGKESAPFDPCWKLVSRGDTLEAETQIRCLDGKSLLLCVTTTLRFEGQKRMLMIWLAIAFVVAAVVFSVAGLILQERLVLQRLFHLEQDVAGIAAGSSLRVHVAGSDEIARLGSNIDQMVESLRRATMELRRTRDISERAERAKTRLVASVSHEMRTPLNGILGLADLLRRSTNLSVEDLENADMVSEAGSQLLMTVNTLLDHSRLETGELELNSAVFRIEDVVGGAVSDVMAMAHRKGLAVHVEFNPFLPACLQGDSERLRQLLRNLLDNAVKFTVMGEVVLKVGRGADGDGVLFEISDTGIGIDVSRLQAIFRPFEQAGAETFFAFGGIGLGLSISRLLAECMGGRIEVQSVPGKGSLFSVLVALPAAEAGELLVDAAHWAGLKGRRVVVAHPSGKTRAILAKILLRVGVDVQELERPEDYARLAAHEAAFWGFDDECLGANVRIGSRDGHEKGQGQGLLFAPFLPSEVLKHCCELLRSPLRVGMHIPNAVLRTLVAGILRKVGHSVVNLDDAQMPGDVDVVVLDIREGEGNQGGRLAQLRAEHPGAEIVVLVGAFQMVSGLDGCHRVKRPVDAASLLWQVEGWARAATAKSDAQH